jgi:hypothetical protein
MNTTILKPWQCFCLIGSLLGACSGEVRFNLVVYDPCDQDQAPLAAVEHIQLEIRDLNQIEDPRLVTWAAGLQQGQVVMPTFDRALVSVYGRMGDGSGNPGALVAAGSVGPLNLAGAEGVVDLNIAVGQVGEFMGTTDMVEYLGCTALGGARRGHSATLLADGRVFLAGGVSPSPQENTLTYWNTTEFYSPRTGRFTAGPNMTWQRQGHAATTLDDGRVLLSGGTGLLGVTATEPGVEQIMRVASLFDPELGSFESPVQLQVARDGHSATLLGDGRVLLAGGVSQGGQVLASTEIFDPITGITSLGPTLLAGRGYHSAVRLGSLQVMLIGGRGNSVLSTTEFVDVSTNTVVAGPSLAVARSHAKAALMPGQSTVIAVMGGFSSVVTSPEFGFGLDSIEWIQINTINPVASTLANCPSVALKEGRGDFGLIESGTGLMVVGGVGSTGAMLSSAEFVSVLDLGSCAVGINTLPDALTTARGGMSVTPLFGGDVLLAGGFTNDDGEVVAVAKGELYVGQR